MSVRTTIGIFASGFVVYAVVSALVAPSHRASGGGAAASLKALTDPVPFARADSGSRLKAEFLLGDDGTKDYQLTVAPWRDPLQLFVNVNARPVNLYWDSMRSEECAFQIGGDGQKRCLPTDLTVSPGGQLGYTDASCTTAGIGIIAGAPGCTIDVPKYVFTYDAEPACGPVAGSTNAHVYPTGAFVGPNLNCYQPVNGTCTYTGCWGNGSTPPFAVYAVGAEVPASSFVGFTPAHDP